MIEPQPAAFDAFAQTYDATFSDTLLGRLLRQRVWRALQAAFPPGSHVLEIACGTGRDAAWLAQQGVRITATDGSQQMIEAARATASQAGVAHNVETRIQTLQELAQATWPDPPPFDGAFSNFGGLNTVADLRPLARSLAQAVRSGGRLVLAPMGPFCPWEILWHLAHRQPVVAWRRFKPPASAVIGSQTIPIWYPGLRRLKRQFAPWFRLESTRSLGLFLPPSYLGHLVERHPHIASQLNWLEQRLAPLTRSWGDHYLSVLVRTSTPSNRS